MRRCSACCALVLLLSTIECGNCLYLDSGALLGIVVCDFIITVLIALAAYYLSNKVQKRRQEERGKKLESERQANEPTYEELHGQNMDIYTDLNQQPM
ncbi:TYRO protein tyrosine kinase-binding protein isoform X2 [Ascaphus truei]|uniref:TYRO protein tyrosine kinase-binding protein isoform X2 n=1 Tax=Ascaphus truei TaxID=8439 RepID=UPI003F5A760E